MIKTFEQLPENSRIWIYQSSQVISNDIQEKIVDDLELFLQDWNNHGNNLFASGTILHNRFIILGVDESKVNASGCSIDKSMQFIQLLEKKYNLDLLDRMNVLYESEGVLKMSKLFQLSELHQSKSINENTLVYNNLIQTKKDLTTGWLIPIGKSWHRNQL